jgi:hypothetical protein
MSPAGYASVVFFLYCAAVAAIRPGTAPARTFVGAAAGLILTLGWGLAGASALLHDWVLPPLVLLVGYWTSGTLYTGAMPAAERALAAFDRRLGIQPLARRLPRWAAEGLEVAYVGVYPLIPIALVIHLWLTPDPDPSRFWAVILITDYVCFGMLPWVQTRPPRTLEGGAPWRSSVRLLNQRLLGAASIGVNTFPSGHAAEALAAALLVASAPPAVFAWMLFTAAAIAAGAVLGRYHYAADALAGFAVALGVWGILL